MWDSLNLYKKWDAWSEDRKGWWHYWWFSYLRFILDCVFDNSMNPYVNERTKVSSRFMHNMFLSEHSLYIVIEYNQK